MIDSLVHPLFSLLAVIFALCLGVAVAAVIVIYLIDINQSKSTIRRNYPVIGRFRYLFEHLGEFFRQYFFSMDREELPFNRAQRSWVYRAAKGVSTNVGFGSTRNMYTLGEPNFINSAFALLDSEHQPGGAEILFGPYCTTPYTTKSFFHVSGMSYGSISKPAVIALARGAARAGCWLNTGEGGLSAHHLATDTHIVFQVGTAKYGVRDRDGNLSEARLRELGNNPQVKMFEIKLSQGAKPGKGGILPGSKVTSEIAAIRGIDVGRDSISPNRHLDIGNNQELLDRIHYIRQVTGKPVGFKAVISDIAAFAELCALIASRAIELAPDFITVDSADGGTGASPQPLMDFVGLPLRESLPAVIDHLHRAGLKQRIRVIASGKQITPAYVAQSLAYGADAVVSVRGFMLALGCIQALQCHQNSCPTGITTHNPRLQRGLDPADKASRVARYHKQIVQDVEMIAHSCGVKHPLQLRREHVHLVQQNGKSISLSELYPGTSAIPSNDLTSTV